VEISGRLGLTGAVVAEGTEGTVVSVGAETLGAVVPVGLGMDMAAVAVRMASVRDVACVGGVVGAAVGCGAAQAERKSTQTSKELTDRLMDMRLSFLVNLSECHEHDSL
jgi:hypothetical protein